MNRIAQDGDRVSATKRLVEVDTPIVFALTPINVGVPRV
nr:hypothetical protein REQ54_03798 [Rhizobium sp. Q54]